MQGKQLVVKAGKVRCVRPCIWQGKFNENQDHAGTAGSFKFIAGQEAEVVNGELVPRHFEAVTAELKPTG